MFTQLVESPQDPYAIIFISDVEFLTTTEGKVELDKDDPIWLKCQNDRLYNSEGLQVLSVEDFSDHRLSTLPTDAMPVRLPTAPSSSAMRQHYSMEYAAVVGTHSIRHTSMESCLNKGDHHVIFLRTIRTFQRRVVSRPLLRHLSQHRNRVIPQRRNH